MNLNSNDWFFIFIIGIGIYTMIRGVMTLTTGKLHPKEEAALQGYSENGIRRFKLLSALTNIIGGLAVIAMEVIRLLNLVDRNVLMIATLVVIAVMLAVYFLIRNSCKKI